MISPEYSSPIYIIAGVIFSLLGAGVLIGWVAIFISDSYKRENIAQWVGIIVMLLLPMVFAPFYSSYLLDRVAITLGLEAICGSLPCGFVALTMEDGR